MVKLHQGAGMLSYSKKIRKSKLVGPGSVGVPTWPSACSVPSSAAAHEEGRGWKDCGKDRS
ncbi:hypothetical protein LEMLEM_LOCUS16962 [Lemmus lemmus]